MSNTVKNQLISLFSVVSALDSRINFLQDMFELVGIENGQVVYINPVLKKQQEVCITTLVEFILFEVELELLRDQRESVSKWFSTEYSTYMSAEHANKVFKKSNKVDLNKLGQTIKHNVYLIMVSSSLVNNYGYFNNAPNYYTFLGLLHAIKIKNVIKKQNQSYSIHLENGQKQLINHYSHGYFSIV